MTPRSKSLSRRVLLGSTAVVASVSIPTAAQASTSGSIDAEVQAIEADLIAFRRDLNANPEGPGQEARTSAKVAGALTAAGLEVATGVGGYGVVGVLRGRHRGRTVAYRADMDAVPPVDQIGGGTAPKHLWGHDIHTTVGVGIAQVLARLRRDPEEIHALHCGLLPVGVFGVNPGSGLPGQDRGSISLTGDDAAERAAQLAADIGALATVARPQSPADLEQLLVDLQAEDGPLASFVFTRAFADGGEVRFSSRCWPEERYTEVRADIDRLAQSYGATAVLPNDPFPAMVCPAPEANELKRFLRRDGVETEVVRAAVPFSGKDFALFLDEIPGTYTYPGVRSPGADVTTGYPHFPTFTPDEAAIGHEVRAMSKWLVERAGC